MIRNLIIYILTIFLIFLFRQPFKTRLFLGYMYMENLTATLSLWMGESFERLGYSSMNTNSFQRFSCGNISSSSQSSDTYLNKCFGLRLQNETISFVYLSGSVLYWILVTQPCGSTPRVPSQGIRKISVPFGFSMMVPRRILSRQKLPDDDMSDDKIQRMVYLQQIKTFTANSISSLSSDNIKYVASQVKKSNRS
ncbi:hypothetical protein GLOIN_2v1486092 [Rhizophagus clarus]|uniref:Uncharacterized protein n=1 Tax=Rhizophagus clarus TaxID=94130 RepID=A0A8H3R1T2_9GLOM|nr:hypothetical protein GLOIN_2v1486092 [Rhizophagus clarus]